MHKRSKQPKGFTLAELLVAVSILGIMLFLINNLFQTTSVAVTTSVQQTKAVASTRLIGEQLQNDTAQDVMLGPGPALGNGYLMIIQRRVRDVTLQNPTNLAEFTTPFIRSDQLVFIRDAGGLRSMTPQDAGRFGTNLVGEAGGHAKVWYGHVQRTNNDGTIPGNSTAFQLGGADAGFDRIGSNWILGRQAMLFNPSDPERAAPNRLRNNRGDYTSADNAFFNSQVRGATGPVNRSYAGITDVTAQSYVDPNPALSLSSILTDYTRTDTNNLYLNTAYRRRDFPLRVNPSPTGTNYASWSLAQTHGTLTPNCSDFVVQFAADINGNGRLDTTANGGTDQGGSIRWYDGFSTNTNWNNIWQAIDTSRPGRVQPFVNIDANTRAFIFRLDDDRALSPASTGFPPLVDRQQRSMWPYLIRIRYRLHGNRGRLAGNDPTALTDGLDNDGDGQADNADPELNEDQIPGRWFEHIIRVPRP